MGSCNSPRRARQSAAERKTLKWTVNWKEMEILKGRCRPFSISGGKNDFEKTGAHAQFISCEGCLLFTASIMKLQRGN